MYTFLEDDNQKNTKFSQLNQEKSAWEMIHFYVKNHVVDLIMIVCAVAVTSINSLDLFTRNDTVQNSPDVNHVLGVASEPVSNPKPRELFVEISGAVLFPDVYVVSEGTRLKDVIRRSGGYTKDAAIEYVGRNFNLSRFVGDQEKIYVPTKTEISQGIFLEEPKLLSYLAPAVVKNSQAGPSNQSYALPNDSTGTISINKATLQELDTLPNIGPTTAQKIIDGRPYRSIEELSSRQIVKTSVFTQIKNLLSL